MPAVEALRTLGALAIMFFHFSVYPMPPSDAPSAGKTLWLTFWTHGYAALFSFALITGALAGKSFLGPLSPLEFLRPRLQKIYLWHWAGLAVVFAMIVAVKWTTGTNDVSPLPQTAFAWMAVISLATHPLTSVPAMDWVTWYLSCTIVCLFPAASALLFKQRSLLVLAVLHTAACTMLFLSPTAAKILQLWPFFILGLAWTCGTKEHRHTTGFMIVTAFLVILALGLREGKPHGICATLIALTAVIWNKRPLPWPSFWRWGGRISFALFLVHVPVGINGVLSRLPFDLLWMNWTAAALASVLAAVLLTRFMRHLPGG